MEATDHEMAKITGEDTRSLIAYLLDKGTIESTDEEGNYKVNVEKLVGQRLQTGNGSDKKDVYMLEEVKGVAEIGKVASTEKIKLAATKSTSKEYNIKYYGKTEADNKDLGKLTDNGGEGSTNAKEALIKELEEMYYIQAYKNESGDSLEGFRIYLLSEEEYKTKITDYIWNNDEELSKMTDEEIVLKQEQSWGETQAKTFEEYMKELGKDYKTAKEFLMQKYSILEEEYESTISDTKAQLIEIYNPNNDYAWNSYNITEMGEYEYTVKVAGEERFSYTITIDQYEVVSWYNSDVHKNVISVYDFKNSKTLEIESASYEYKEDSETNYTKETITKEQIINEGSINNYIKEAMPYYGCLYKFNITAEEKQVGGIYYLEKIVT